MNGMKAYLADAAGRVATVVDGQEDAFEAAAAALVRTIRDDRLVYVFGTGHSHMMAEEGHYRAGGLACVVPVLASTVMLHEGAVAGSALERTPGLAAIVLSRYAIGAGDVMFVFSNSGVNAVPVEAAHIGRERGATVIAVTSEIYSRAAANGRERLAEVADIVLDNKGPAGDAVVDLGGGLRTAPISTVVGAAILNGLLAEAAQRLTAAGEDVPVYISANMPGAAERNSELVERFRSRNPHL
ncbi:SIS domain-containing protein [Faunimonas pinastri]|nr:SIS domain-containing protein [Faunimonas pinastri]